MMGSMAWLFSFLLFASFLFSTISDNGIGTTVMPQPVVVKKGNQNPADDQGHDGHYHDTTNFLTGVNGWDFTGSWAKYDLNLLQQAQVHVQAVPPITDSQEQGVFICQPSAYPSLLEKEFPALVNATFQLTYFVASPKQDLTMNGKVTGAGETTWESLFDYSFPDDLMEHNYTWVTQIFHLPSLTREGKFKIRVVLTSQTTGMWATGMLQVAGVFPPPATTTTEVVATTNAAPPPPPPQSPAANLTTQNAVNATTEGSPVNATTEEPPVNATTEGSPENVTDFETPMNMTTEDPLVNGTSEEPVNTTAPPQLPLVNATTEAPVKTTVVGGLTDTKPPTEEPEAEVGKLANVARAIWDAFYVFLALFCACLVALVGLIVHGRCKREDEPPPAVATYNPRNASYRLDKVYDNPSFDNNAAV